MSVTLRVLVGNLLPLNIHVLGDCVEKTTSALCQPHDIHISCTGASKTARCGSCTSAMRRALRGLTAHDRNPVLPSAPPAARSRAAAASGALLRARLAVQMVEQDL